MAAVRYCAASRVYPGSPTVRAVDSLELDITDGEFLVVVGPSGSGKSTALRMLAGLEDVDEGSIDIGGRDVTDLPPKDRDIAMVFQNYALYPHMTVAENMAFALKLRKIPRSDIEQRVNSTAAMLDLTPYLERRPKALSGGQRQRVAMGRAIVREPSVFLMDEPLSNLDAKLRVETRANLASLQSRLRTTTVYVTHDQVEAMTMGDRVAVMRDGVLQQCAAPRELYARPVNDFVAAFIGSPGMNLHTLPLTETGAHVDGFVIPLSRAVSTTLSTAGHTTARIGIRPEALRPIGGDQPGLKLEVEIAEELGSDTFVHARTLGADNFKFVARADARIDVRPGDKIRVGLTDPNAVHVFDPVTGLRIST